MKKILKNLIILVTIISVMSGFTLTASASDPYVEDYKWNTSTISYYFDKTPSTSGIPQFNYDDYWVPAVYSGITRWNLFLNYMNFNLQFYETTNINNADIVLQFGPSGGLANTAVTNIGSTIVSATIYLDDIDFYSYSFDDPTITDITAHEIGHSIGLKDISPANAEALDIYSIMVQGVFHSHFSSYQTIFDYNNIIKLY